MFGLFNNNNNINKVFRYIFFNAKKYHEKTRENQFRTSEVTIKKLSFFFLFVCLAVIAAINDFLRIVSCKRTEETGAK